MSKRDTELIVQARCTTWEAIVTDKLLEQAESDEARTEINRILMRKYHIAED